MDAKIQKLIEGLNDIEKNMRLSSLASLMEMVRSGKLERPAAGNDVNNHIHTIYSFSPYSPSKAVWMAFNAGLKAAGIMDHDSISGAEEFIEAGRIAGIATTIGVECRADFSKTPFNGRRINNPDQDSVAYVTLHGVPHTQVKKVKAFFKLFSFYRNVRNMEMIKKLNGITSPFGIALDFAQDVAPLSMFSEDGSITERHILYALSLKLIDIYGKGPGLLDFLKNSLKLAISPKVEAWLSDTSNPHYGYDLLGLLKSELVGRFYLDAGLECPDIKEVAAFAKSIGAIPAYAYLGDVGSSVTGDKKAQKFEDDYVEQLFGVLKELGFEAVTYMPSRNSAEQLDRIRALCKKHGFFQISGEDINSSRQSFICEALRDEKYSNLYDSTWALIGHELSATENPDAGMFSPDTVRKHPDLNERIQVYKEIGLRLSNL